MKITDTLSITTLLFLTFAFTEVQSQSVSSQQDIILLMDISSSMLSEDLTPNRLEVGKKELLEFVDECEESQLGLIVFAGETRIRCSLTNDKALVKDFITYSKCGVLAGGTKMEVGILAAIDNLKEQTAKKKIIILLTDGINNTPTSDRSIIEKAKVQKIKIYAICLGSWNIGVTTIGFKSDETPVFGITDLKIEEDFLTTLTQKTNGRFFRATNSKDLKSIFRKIHQLEH